MVDYDCSSLPPKVVGPVHGFLDIRIDQVFWNRRKNSPIKIKLHWWGQDRSEFIFRLGNKNEKTLHTYSIHTTLQLFRDYLKNSVELTLSVVDEQMGTIIGTCTIKNLNSVISEVPNEQFYPIVNQFDSVIGKLRVSFRLCPISDQKPDRLKSSSVVSSLRKKTENYLSSDLDSDSYVNKTIIKKVFKRGQRLRNAMIETILDNDPLNKDVYNTNIPNLTTFRKRLPEPSSISSRPTENFISTDDASKKILDYLMGANVSIMEEKQILDKLRNLSPTTSMIKLAADIHFHKNDHRSSSSKSNVDQSVISEQEIEIPSKISDKYSNVLKQYIEPKPSAKQEQKIKIINYIDSLKIFIHYLKLNSTGWRKVRGNNSTNQMLKSTTFFIDISMPTLLTQDEQKKFPRINLKKNVKKFSSRKIVNEVIQFEQQSIFNLNNCHHLNSSNLYVEFKIYCRILSQKDIVQIGTMKYNLSNLLECKDLTDDQELTIFGSNKPLKFGTLRLNIQFGCDQLHFGKDLLDAIYGEKENKIDENRNNCDQLKKTVTESKSDNARNFKAVLNVTRSINENNIETHIPKISKLSPVREIDKKISIENNSLKLLQALIYIPELIFANDEPKCTYLICRAFWRENTTTSKLCYHTQRAIFNFREIVPILYDSEFLKRVKNNFLVIEVWENDGKNEHFLGICKLPLHQFYVAYRDPNIASHLTENKLPVIGFDGWEEIIHPISGIQSGQLHALVAIGTAEQLEFLETSRCINEPSVVRENIIPEIVQNPYKFETSTSTVSENREETRIANKKTVEIPKVSSKIDFVDNIIESNTSKVTDKSKIHVVDKEIQTAISQCTHTEIEIKMSDPPKLSQDQSDTNQNVLNNNSTQKNLLESFLEIAAQLPRPQQVENDKNGIELISQATQIESVSVENKATTTTMDCGDDQQKSRPIIQETSKLLETLQKALAAPFPSPQINNLKNIDLFQNVHHERHTFKAHIVIENAVHLSIRRRRIKNKGKNTKRHIECAPSTYVTFEPIPEKGLLFTSVIQKTINPKWNQHFECYLPKNLLFDDQKRLIFKVWNKNGGDLSQPNIVTDSVIGFAALDLTVLPQGLPSIQGWFNILDFSSRCNGQIKINITPLEDISHCTSESISNYSSSHEATVPPLSLTPESDTFELTPETPSSFSNALKRKFNELDEIRERLKQRLMDVTKSDDDSDCSNKDDIDFEHDINTEPSPEDNLQDFDFTSIKMTEASSKPPSFFNTILSGVSTADSGFGETSTFLKDIDVKSSDRNTQEDLNTARVTLSNLDDELKRSKAQFDVLFEKLCINNSNLDNTNVVTDNKLTNKNVCLEDIIEESTTETTKNCKQNDKNDITLTISSTSMSSDILNTDEIIELHRGVQRDNILCLTSDSSSNFDMNSETLLLNREAPEGGSSTQIQKYNKN